MKAVMNWLSDNSILPIRQSFADLAQQLWQKDGPKPFSGPVNTSCAIVVWKILTEICKRPEFFEDFLNTSEDILHQVIAILDKEFN
jgi:hypothetical protein